MNYMLILGVIGLIAVIALAAYFMSGKKDEGIKHGKYVIKENGENKGYMIVSKDSVEFGGYAGNLPRKDIEFKLIKSGTTFKFDGKEFPVFETSVPVVNNGIGYFAQSLDDSILILGKDPSSGTFSVIPLKFVPTQTL